MNDLYFMDYDTYHQIIGGSFLDYTIWIQSVRPDLLERFSKSSLDDILGAKEDFGLSLGHEDTCNSIVLFILELLGSHKGIVFDRSSHHSMETEEKIEEYFRLYQQAGMSREDTIHMVKKYLKDLRR